MAELSTKLNIENILKYLPHRYPFLLIDKMEDIVPEESATGIKNVTINEPFFPGHFPGKPVMPGVLIIEAMAQTCATLVMHSLDLAESGKIVYFMSIEEAKFRKPVQPGDTLHIKVQKSHNRKNVWKFDCNAYVGETKVSEASVTAMIADN